MDFSLFRQAVLGADVVEASNSAEETVQKAAVSSAGYVRRVKKGRAFAVGILDALEGNKSLLKKAAEQVAWEKILHQLAQAETDEEIKTALAGFIQLRDVGKPGLRRTAKTGVAKRKVGAGLKPETRKNIEEALRVI